MDASWTRTVAPIIEPISATEAKDHTRLTGTADDAAIGRFIQTAREAAEDYLERGLLTQTWRLTLDDFAESIWLPRAAPLQSVTTVEYYDNTGAKVTLATTVYDVDTVSQPGRIVRAANQTWPTLHADHRAGRVIITYVVGWTTAAAVPERIKQGIRLYLAYLESDREGMEPDGKNALAMAQSCWTDRVQWMDPCGRWRS